MKRFLRGATAVFAAFACLAARAGMVATPKAPADQLERDLREAFGRDPARLARLLGDDTAHAGLNPLLIQLIVYGAMVAGILIIGAIAIIVYGFSKKNKEDDRLKPP